MRRRMVIEADSSGDWAAWCPCCDERSWSGFHADALTWVLGHLSLEHPRKGWFLSLSNIKWIEGA